MKLSQEKIQALFSILADADEGCSDRACDNLAEAFGGKLGLGEVVSEIQDPELWWESGCVEACEEILELVK